MDTSKHGGKWSHTFSLFPTSFEVRPALSACFSQQIRKGSDSCYCQAEMLELVKNMPCSFSTSWWPQTWLSKWSILWLGRHSSWETLLWSHLDTLRGRAMPACDKLLRGWWSLWPHGSCHLLQWQMLATYIVRTGRNRGKECFKVPHVFSYLLLLN